MTKENTLWDSAKELEYQIGFDRPIFNKPKIEKKPEVPKSPKPTEPIRRPDHHGTPKKHP